MQTNEKVCYEKVPSIVIVKTLLRYRLQVIGKIYYLISLKLRHQETDWFNLKFLLVVYILTKYHINDIFTKTNEIHDGIIFYQSKQSKFVTQYLLMFCYYLKTRNRSYFQTVIQHKL